MTMNSHWSISEVEKRMMVMVMMKTCTAQLFHVATACSLHLKKKDFKKRKKEKKREERTEKSLVHNLRKSNVNAL